LPITDDLKTKTFTVPIQSENETNLKKFGHEYLKFPKLF